MEKITLNALNSDSWDTFEKQVISQLVPTSEQLTKAINATNARLSQWLRTQALRALSKRLSIPQKILRRRILNFRFSRERNGNSKVWFGMNGIAFDELKPRNYDKGVMTSLGGHYEEGAFVQHSRKTGRLIVLKRRNKTWARKAVRGAVDKVELNIENIMASWITLELNKPEFEAQFYKRLETELKWRTET